MPRFDHLLHFTSLYQTRVWGGRHLEALLHRRLPDDQPYGEAWDLVDRDTEQSRIAAGPLAGTALHDLWTRDRAAVFGEAYSDSAAPRFPLLIKVLDCADDLSVQVHPPASVAPELGGEPKTEMWFVAHAGSGAQLFAGLRRGVTRETFERALVSGEVAECLHRLPAQTGDSLMLASGRVHALGRGLVIYEIQQNSDTTYRVFDWNRPGLDGRLRALHIEESLRSIDFTDIEPTISHGRGELAVCPHFRVTRASAGHRVLPGRFRLIIPIGPTRWAGTSLAPGQLTLCPASFEVPGPDGDWLEIELPTPVQGSPLRRAR